MNILFTGVGRRIELLQAFRNAALVLNKNLKFMAPIWRGRPRLSLIAIIRVKQLQ